MLRFDQDDFSQEEIAKIQAVESARKAKENERDGRARAAYKRALADVGYDKALLVVHTLPEGFGGAVIHKLPSPETMTALSRRAIRDFTSDGKKDNYHRAVASLIEDASLLMHPPLDELQALSRELPGLYAKIHDTIDARCGEGQYAGKG